MIKKYKELQKKLNSILIRSKVDGVVVDLTADWKISKVSITDDELLENKEKLETQLTKAIIKGQKKSQEVSLEKTKELIGFDPTELINWKF